MRMEVSLQARLEQKLRLAPQIIQSIEILQLPALELQDLVKQALEENPTLEEGLETPAEGADGESPASETAETPEAPAESEDTPEEPDLERELDALQTADDAWNDYFSSPGSMSAYSDGEDPKREAMQNTAAPAVSLHDYLIQQVHLTDLIGAMRSSFLADMRDRGLTDEEITDRVRELCEFLIYNLDSNGYLPYTLEEMIEAFLAQRNGDSPIEPSGNGQPTSGETPAEDAPTEAPPDPLATTTDPNGGSGSTTAPTTGLPATAPPDDGIETWTTRSAPPPVEAAPAMAGLGMTDDERPDTTGGVRDPIPGGGLLGTGAEAMTTLEAPPAPIRTEALPATYAETATEAVEMDGLDADDAAPGNNGIGDIPWMAETREALHIVQSLEPPGVGGRDLKEVLLLQIDPDPRKYQFERKLIEEHLEDIQSNRLPKIAKALGCDVDRVKEGLQFLTMLNPRPGSLFAPKTSRYIIPDVVVDEVDGEYEVRLEDTYIPRLHISPHYRRMLAEQGDDPKVREFIKKKLESAKWLIESIEQRQSTLMRICREIVSVQRPFFDFGLEHLKPLKMQHIADRVGVHVSTVSRALSDKYIQSPRGIYPLKFFFTGGTVSSDGTMESTVSIKQKVKDIVDREDKEHPLSDEDIAKKLRDDEGLDIARRTVTKYRKQLGIPSSRQRREY